MSHVRTTRDTKKGISLNSQTWWTKIKIEIKHGSRQAYSQMALNSFLSLSLQWLHIWIKSKRIYITQMWFTFVAWYVGRYFFTFLLAQINVCFFKGINEESLSIHKSHSYFFTSPFFIQNYSSCILERHRNV